MPSRLKRLLRLTEGTERRIVGLMSGTSLDGLDLALCAIRGHGADTRVRLLHFQTVPYTPAERARLAALVSREQVSLRELTVLNAWLAERHAETVMATLAAWGLTPEEVDCIASHGQTVYHAPASWHAPGEGTHASLRHATLQLGDGDHLALRTGILTLSDFRQKERAAGGEGAPLAPYAETLLFSGPVPRILLNLGGIANFTWLPPHGSNAAPVYGDTGPANALMDRAVRLCFPERPEGFDRDGTLAARGTVHGGLLAILKNDPYFARSCPKSTGPEAFGDAFLTDAWSRARALGLSGEDFLATLTRLTVDTVAETLRRERPALAGTELYVSGGGWHNPVIAAGLRAALPEVAFLPLEDLGIPPDAKEAVLFAVLANETLCGEGFTVPLRDTSAPRIGFGKLSFPD